MRIKERVKRIKNLSIAACLAGVVAIATTGCGNENWGFGNYNFTHVHISDHAEGYCATVNSWHDNERGVELHTKEFGNIYLSEGTYILFECGRDCPFCIME